MDDFSKLDFHHLCGFFYAFYCAGAVLHDVLRAMRRQMSVIADIMAPTARGVVSLVISRPPVYSKTFTGWSSRRGDARVMLSYVYVIFAFLI